MRNAEIRKEIAEKGLKHWEVAEAANISEYTLCVWLRKPLNEERTERIKTAIASLCAQQVQGATV